MTMTVTYDYDSFRSDLRKKMHRLGTGRATKSDEFSGGGEGHRPLGTFPKIHPFWYPEPSLRG